MASEVGSFGVMGREAAMLGEMGREAGRETGREMGRCGVGEVRRGEVDRGEVGLSEVWRELTLMRVWRPPQRGVVVAPTEEARSPEQSAAELGSVATPSAQGSSAPASGSSPACA